MYVAPSGGLTYDCSGDAASVAAAPPGVSDPENWSLVELDGKASWHSSATGEFRPVTGGKAVKPPRTTPAPTSFLKTGEEIIAAVGDPAAVSRVTETASLSPKKTQAVQETTKNIVTETKTLTEKARAEEKASGGPSAGLFAAILGTTGIVAGTAILASRSGSKKRRPVQRFPVQQQQQDSVLPIAAGVGLLAVVGITAFILTRK